jgi:hypothetical protein
MRQIRGLPLIDIQQSARGPELIGGDHGRRSLKCSSNMATPYEK